MYIKRLYASPYSKLLVPIAILLISLVVTAVTSTGASAYTKSQIDTMLLSSTPDNGTATAGTWDNACWDNMHANRAAGMDVRTSINQGGAYHDKTWIGYADDASEDTLNVPVGTTEVRLKLYAVTFLCSSLISPDGAGADYARTDDRVVPADGSHSKDAAPNAVGNSGNLPARTDTRSRVTSVSVNNGATLSGLNVGDILNIQRDPGSRYWFDNLGFRMQVPAGTTDETYRITVKSQRILDYNGVYRCDDGDGNYSDPGGWNYSKCATQTDSYDVNVVIQPWKLDPKTSVSSTSILLGDNVTFNHSVKNETNLSNGDPTGPTPDVASTIYGWIQGQGESIKNATRNLGSINPGQTVAPSGYSRTVNPTSMGVGIGQTYCENVRASPFSKTDRSVKSSTAACATVHWWDQNPTMTGAGAADDVVEAGTSVTLNANINNSGDLNSDGGSVRQFTRFIAGAGVQLAANSSSSSAPCQYYVPSTACTAVSTGTGSVSPGDTAYSFTDVIGDVPVGTRICYSFSDKNHSAKDGNWAHTAAKCYKVGRKPKVQVLGGDIYAGKPFTGATGALPAAKIQTSLSSKDKMYGSWGEYLASATGSITGLATGAGLAGGSSGYTICGASLFTLANTPNASNCANGASQGYYSTSTSIPDVASTFPIGATTPAISGNIDLGGAPGQYVYKASGDINVTGGSITKGRSVIINAPNNTVTISGNIQYDTSAMTSISDIPQVVIIAKDINVIGANAGSAVSQIDAWLITKGTLNTCADAGSGKLSIAVCNTQLVVNGPVMTGKIQLRRTAGSGTGPSSGDPAEVFNFRPDAYLWGLAEASKSSQLETTYVQELPPRF